VLFGNDEILAIGAVLFKHEAEKLKHAAPTCVALIFCNAICIYVDSLPKQQAKSTRARALNTN
jgi:hypothetical protein